MSRCTLGQGIFPWIEMPSYTDSYMLGEVAIPGGLYRQMTLSVDPRMRELAKTAVRIPWMGA